MPGRGGFTCIAEVTLQSLEKSNRQYPLHNMVGGWGMSKKGKEVRLARKIRMKN
jgi:hypothetical protein